MADGTTDLAPGERYPVPEESRFKRGLRDLEFIDAPDLEVLAGLLVQERDLLTAGHFRVKYLWKREGGKAQGKCIKASGPAKHYSEADFIIWLAADQVRDNKFTLRQVNALLYHEHLHIAETTEGGPATRDHDVEVFREELESFGLWDTKLQQTLGQLEMPLGWGASR